MFQRILVPTDGSKGARRAVRAAVAVARLSGGRLIALHVVEPDKPDAVETPASGGAEAVLASPPGTVVHDPALGEVAAAARDAGIPVEAEQRVDPQPAHAIVDVAEKFECDLIVMASHGYGDILSIVTGSTTARVVSGCDVPVLVVH